MHALTAVISTWPLVAHLGDGVPQGREPVATVPYFNLWSIDWTARTLPHSISRWWDAPIFAPLTGSYARSELQPVTGLAYGVLRWFVSAPAAYGMLVLLALVLNGLTANALARRLGAGAVMACVLGVFAQTVPFLFEQLGVLQLLMVWPVLLTVHLMLDWADRPRVRTALGVGVAMSLAYLTCSYHAALFGLAAIVCAPLLVHRSWLGEWRVRALGVLVAALAFGALALPFAIGQQRRLHGATWTRATIHAGSASWTDLVPGGQYWVGTVVFVLAAAGVVVARRERRTWFLVALAGVASIVAMGTKLSLFGWRPYAVLVDHVSVFARMRSPFRAVALAQVLLVVLAAPFAQWCWSRRARAARPALAVAFVLAAMPLELGSGPIAALPAHDLVWATWLRDHPGGIVAMMPMPVERPVEYFEPTTIWMLKALDHGHPLVNGYTGFFPPDDRAMRQRMAAFPDAATVAELRSMGVEYVVADSFWWNSDRDHAARGLGVEPILGGPDGVLLRVQKLSSSGN